ncbi:Hint domain-containing protein [Acidisoma cellulosilytica]|uniref:Hint domain-containing protein n=1 Tax=Acidisoma cellulosilyticum TaxID=2802395 RepID=A0A964E4Z7_9PROT|nr:Hint domain-containing protein [Acidisoma cellulosilyticum]MCB8882165.1 Hint domain-containing protein [Acidisoma cellulosilyticum]
MSSTSTEYQLLTAFTAGDLVISVVGDVNNSGTYTDNQATPIALEELSLDGTASASIVGELVLPQTTTVENGTTEYAISGEYGSSSEGYLQLSEDGQSLTIGGYGVNAATYNTGGAAVYGDPRLAQSTSLLDSSYTPVARVIADIGYDTSVDTSTAVYNVFNTNNIRSVATVDGTSFYITGQGVKGDDTQGVFYVQDGANSATAIDTTTDTRDAQIVDGVLYVSRDSTQGGTDGTSEISSYGTLLPVSDTTAEVLPNIDGSVMLTTADANAVNGADVGSIVNLSPESYFFADADTLYVADSGNPKAGGLGDGGLQKWTFNGTDWVLDYTLSDGLDLVANTATSGTTGLIGLTGTVTAGGEVLLYATNSTLGDLDQTYLYGITDELSATTAQTGESFVVLETAATDTNIRGVSFAPTSATTSATATTVSSGSPLSGTTLTSGSAITVLSGGIISDITALSGSTILVSAGGTDTDSTIAQGATETVLGTATGDQVQGMQIVDLSGAIISDETVYNGGTIEVLIKGVTATDITLDNGGLLYINGSSTAVDTVIENGGIVDLDSAKASVSGSLTFIGSGTFEETTVVSSNEGDLAVISGFGVGDVIDLTAISGGTLTTQLVSGNTVATLVGNAGTETFTFAGNIGAYLSTTTDAGSGTEIVYVPPAPVETVVSSGATSTGLTVTSGGTVTVNSGGSIVSATILSGGSAMVSGSDTDSVISAGGIEVLSGTATGDQIYGYQNISFGTATAFNETVFSGGTIGLDLKDAILNDTTISSGGTFNLNGNVSGTGTTVLMSGGVIDLQSPKANLLGSLIFSGAATLEETDIVSSSFGVSATISGFGTGDVIDLTNFGSGAVMTSAFVGGNLVETVSSGGNSESFTFAGSGLATSLTLTSDGTGGVAIVYGAGTVVSSGSSSGSSTETVVSSGVKSSGLTVSSGGSLTVSAGGSVLSTTILSGGSATLDGSETDTVISAGGSELLVGSATGDQVYGTQTVSGTAPVAVGETVYGGGVIDVTLKGAVLSNTTIAGGTLAIDGNAAATGTTILTSGGVINLQSPKANMSGSLVFSGAGTLEETDVTTAAYGLTSAVISGFGTGDAIDLTQFASATLTAAVVSGNLQETVTSGGTTETFTFAGTDLSSSLSLVADGTGGEEIVFTAPCFAAGTLILTEQGEVKVEDLRIGDRLITASGAALPVNWIGHRQVICRRHAEPQKVLPVRIAAGAFGETVPARDLYLSPDHAVFAEGVLIPVKHLINGTSVRQIEAEAVTYFHVELTQHDIILAEGLATESYLDTGDRRSFANGGGAVTLHPSWASEAQDLALIFESLGAAPLRVTGIEVDSVKASVARQAERAASIIAAA